MIILDAIVNVFVFLVLCTVACGVGTFFAFLILCAKRKSVNYDNWEDLVAQSFWKIIFIGVIVALCICTFILK